MKVTTVPSEPLNLKLRREIPYFCYKFSKGNLRSPTCLPGEDFGSKSAFPYKVFNYKMVIAINSLDLRNAIKTSYFKENYVEDNLKLFKVLTFSLIHKVHDP